MRKYVVTVMMLSLVACSHSENVDLARPQQVETGFVQVLNQPGYYIDSASIWIDSKSPAVINFDMVTNLSQGQQGFKHYPTEIAKSVRSHKKINCQTNTYSRAGEIVYSDFWGKGIALSQHRQLSRTITIQPDTRLDTVAKVLCANFYKD
ncbi:surface-adhesin protein E [Volucribacter psittacicida]|uniref:Surface-adhesin protein E n=1 Tax=Volucribacter psittacicida TaxID=203482 RepID=A0A4R1FN01_9PAST|nr:surface-adhesin E family protein [Volucribacter psittacicida]TCJ94842.1 surface-adhesin protein E [Volucribacter psittacicida]